MPASISAPSTAVFVSGPHQGVVVTLGRSGYGFIGRHDAPMDRDAYFRSTDTEINSTIRVGARVVFGLWRCSSDSRRDVRAQITSHLPLMSRPSDGQWRTMRRKSAAPSFRRAVWHARPSQSHAPRYAKGPPEGRMAHGQNFRARRQKKEADAVGGLSEPALPLPKSAAGHPNT
jgi:hypothetical protein